jgi:ubiquinone/menaquinone biosynthesis C-methylase UbiE
MNGFGPAAQTQRVYEDPDIVKGYTVAHLKNPREHYLLPHFASLVRGQKLLDLGCGPGIDSYWLQELGFKVTGLDYSEEMLKAAQIIGRNKSKPTFLVGDMHQLKSLFAANEFDGVWASASLLHIQKDEIGTVLEGINDICKPGAPVYISLKAGEGTETLSEDKYGKPMLREFTFWSKEGFEEVARNSGLVVQEYYDSESTTPISPETKWHVFIFKVEK